jgi:hypothetical protein
MNREELKKILADLQLDPDSYSLTGGLPNERYVLAPEPDGHWAVYYSERGERSGLRLFDLEADACVFFLDLIKHDLSSVRRSHDDGSSNGDGGLTREERQTKLFE